MDRKMSDTFEEGAGFQQSVDSSEVHQVDPNEEKMDQSPSPLPANNEEQKRKNAPSDDYRITEAQRQKIISLMAEEEREIEEMETEGLMKTSNFLTSMTEDNLRECDSDGAHARGMGQENRNGVAFVEEMAGQSSSPSPREEQERKMKNAPLNDYRITEEERVRIISLMAEEEREIEEMEPEGLMKTIKFLISMTEDIIRECEEALARGTGEENRNEVAFVEEMAVESSSPSPREEEDHEMQVTPWGDHRITEEERQKIMSLMAAEERLIEEFEKHGVMGSLRRAVTIEVNVDRVEALPSGTGQGIRNEAPFVEIMEADSTTSEPRDKAKPKRKVPPSGDRKLSKEERERIKREAREEERVYEQIRWDQGFMRSLEHMIRVGDAYFRRIVPDRIRRGTMERNGH